MPIIMQGADIVWADVERDLNIDPVAIKYAITDKTKAIVVIHWGGYPCDMEEIKKVAGDIPIIEDCAHAYGSEYQGSPIGSCEYSDYAMFSFQAIKHLTSVDGGALCCKNEDDYKRGKLLRWYGIDRESPRTDFRCEEDIIDWGYKFHMNDVCATIGLSNMNIASENIRKATDNAKYFENELSGIDGIELPQIKKDRKSSYWLFTMLVENRSEFTYMMGSKGIAVSRVHERNDKHTCFSKFKKDLPGLESIINEMICIPVGWWLSKEDREYIVDCIKSGW
jgi:dTDP-4-amino-4,6-dideoxygalactose transaminase